MFRVLMAERAAPVEQICYVSAGFWFSKLCIGSLMLAAWGNAFRGVPKGLYYFFHETPTVMGRSCPFILRARSV